MTGTGISVYEEDEDLNLTLLIEKTSFPGSVTNIELIITVVGVELKITYYAENKKEAEELKMSFHDKKLVFKPDNALFGFELRGKFILTTDLKWNEKNKKADINLIAISD